MNKGKRTKMTDKVIDKLIELISKGIDTRSACDIVCIGESTWYDYAKKHPEVLERLEEAKSNRIAYLMSKIEDLADNKNLGALKYIISRTKPEYSEKQQVNVTGENYNYNYNVRDPKGNVIQGINWDNVLESDKDKEELEN